MQGFINLHRKIIYSEIYTMPPLYLRVFERLVLEANHKDVEIPYKGKKRLIKRGQRLTSIRQICNWVGWFERGKFKEPNPKTISEIINWLCCHYMISIESNSQETLYNIVKYDVYQVLHINQSNSQVNSKRIQTIMNNNKDDEEEDACARVSSREYKKVQESFSGNGFGQLPDVIAGEIRQWLDLEKFPAELIIAAIKEAVDHSAKSWAYVRRCLNDWEKLSIKTCEQLEAHKAQREEKKTESKKKQGGQFDKVPQKTNYEQRKYDDEFYKSLYHNE